MKDHPPYVSHDEEQVAEFRRNPNRAIAYLNSCIQVAFEENDPELVLTALATVAKAYGMTRVAKEAAVKRESLHRMLSKRGNPEWNSMFRVFKALHLRPRLESTEHFRGHHPA
jgi:probable addiction module antidote protein